PGGCPRRRWPRRGGHPTPGKDPWDVVRSPPLTPPGGGRAADTSADPAHVHGAPQRIGPGPTHVTQHEPSHSAADLRHHVGVLASAAREVLLVCAWSSART